VYMGRTHGPYRDSFYFSPRKLKKWPKQIVDSSENKMTSRSIHFALNTFSIIPAKELSRGLFKTMKKAFFLPKGRPPALLVHRCEVVKSRKRVFEVLGCYKVCSYTYAECTKTVGFCMAKTARTEYKSLPFSYTHIYDI
jgi:hypothetical protein